MASKIRVPQPGNTPTSAASSAAPQPPVLSGPLREDQWEVAGLPLKLIYRDVANGPCLESTRPTPRAVGGGKGKLWVGTLTRRCLKRGQGERGLEVRFPVLQIMPLLDAATINPFGATTDPRTLQRPGRGIRRSD